MSEPTPEPTEPTPTEPTPTEPTEPQGVDYGGSQAEINAAKEKAHQEDNERLAAEHKA
jgi:hypothetical protein